MVEYISQEGLKTNLKFWGSYSLTNKESLKKKLIHQYTTRMLWLLFKKEANWVYCLIEKLLLAIKRFSWVSIGCLPYYLVTVSLPSLFLFLYTSMNKKPNFPKNTKELQSTTIQSSSAFNWNLQALCTHKEGLTLSIKIEWLLMALWFLEYFACMFQ